MTEQETFLSAVKLHQSGQLEAALAIYEQVLVRQPRHAGALAMSGLIALQKGDATGAVERLARAAAEAPNQATYQAYFGQALAAAGRLDEAIGAYRQSVTLQPNVWHVQFNMGNALYRLGRIEPAVAAFEKAAELQPKAADVQVSLGVALDRLEKWDEAIAALEKAIQLSPGMAIAHANLGNALAHKKDFAAAVAAFDRALALDGRDADTWFKLVVALRDSGQWERAGAACRRLLELRPGFTDAELIVAQSRMGQGELDEAIGIYRQILKRLPGSAQTLNNLGIALLAKADYSAAMDAFDQARQANPDDALAQFNYGIELLRRGDFERGWPQYRWRWKRPGCAKSGPTQPRWDGGDLNGQRIVIYGEQGYGDTLQFIRYVPLVAQRGAKIALACHEHLRRVLKCIEPVEHWIDGSGQVPPHTAQCPLMDLPEVMGTTLASTPARVPYIRADVELAARWRERLGGEQRKKIGLVWAGRATPDPKRTMPAEYLGGLADLSGVRWVSLQKPDGGEGAKAPPLEMADWSAELLDFADTAALIENLDLVVTIDTAVAHLAGAMGKAVWVLLPFAADWRWMLDRTDSPWYPTMRLFRQKKDGDWARVIREVKAALQ